MGSPRRERQYRERNEAGGANAKAVQMMETYQIFVGIDWGTEQHAVCVTDPMGRRMGERRFDHSGVALADLVQWITGFAGGEAAHVAVALETPRGPVVDALLERGCHVFALNPKQLARFRDRFSVAGAKDDARDAAVLSSALRTDRPVFRLLQVDAPITLQLREFSRQNTELGEDLRRLTNRLRDHLVRTWPEILRLVPAADEPWLWTLLKRAPTSLDARRLSSRQLEQLVRMHRIRRFTADDLRAVLHAPSVSLAPGLREGVRVRLLDLVEQLPVLARQRAAAERRLAQTLDTMTTGPDEESGREQTDAAILQSLPGIGTRIAATLLADAADALQRRDYHALRQLGGVAPVTKRSGKTCVVLRRHACDRRVLTALHLWARGCVQRDPRCRAHYARLRQAGHNDARALRGVTDRMLAVLVAMLKHRTMYDPAQRELRVA
jgi:transposase